MPASRPTRARRRLSLLVLLGTVLLGAGLVTATWQYDYLSCAYTACEEQPSVEGTVWWQPAAFSTWASVHACADDRVLEGEITRTAPNGCWTPTYVQLWSEQSPNTRLWVLGSVNWSGATGLYLYCDGDDVVTDYSDIC